MRQHHIGIVVESIEDSMLIYEKLGYNVDSEIVLDNIQNNKLLFLKEKSSNQLIELIQPMNENSPVYNQNNRGLHHICYEVENLDEYIISFKRLKIGKIFTDKIDAPAFSNRKIIFACLKDGNIIEVLQKDDLNGK